MNHLSLCSGIGGLDLAAEWAGFRTVAQCEIDEYASRVLAKNFKGVPNLHDIRTVTNGRLRELGIRPEDITVISAGFPCQPYSLAGKGRGDRDERDLWGEVKRVLGDLRPRWFVGENTPGLFARENHRYFRRVLDDLAALGYSVAWGIWGACDVGAPHKRDRVFIVAHADGERRKVKPTEKRESYKGVDQPSEQASFGAGSLYGTAREGVFYPGDVPDAVIKRRDTNAIQRGELAESWGTPSEGRIQTCGLQSKRVCGGFPHAAGDELGVFGRAGEIAEIARRGSNQRGRAERDAGGEWWEVEPDVGRVAHGVPARVDRLRGLGNAVVPYQALPLFEAIAEYELFAQYYV